MEISEKKKVFIRVPKQQIKRDISERPDPLDYCIECWQIYMYGNDRDLKVKTMPLMGNTDSYDRDPAEEEQGRMMRIGAATDAMIDSLSRIHHWAIYKLSSIGGVWDFPNADILQIGPVAMADLRVKLKSNVCTGILF